MNNLRPLRKRSADGILYKRRAHIEALIHACHELAFDELCNQAEISTRNHAKYIPSEVLVYFLRETKKHSTDIQFERLYQLLEKRIKQVIFLGGKKPDVHHLNFLEYVLDDFALRVIMDRQEYEEKLDMFESSFDSTIAKRKIDAIRKMYRKDKPNVQLEYNENGEVHANVERGHVELNPNVSSIENDITYRFELQQAIDTLSEDEKRVINMIFAGIPSESKDTDTPSISTILNCGPQTVRNRRDRAVKKLQAILGTEMKDVN